MKRRVPPRFFKNLRNSASTSAQLSEKTKSTTFKWLQIKKGEIMHENEISYAIRGAAFKVHTALGPGLLESVYEIALSYELRQEGFEVQTQLGVPVIYDEIKMEQGFRMDLLVNNKVTVEIKSVETLLDVHHKQVLTYLKLSEKKLGLLINFNSLSLKNSITRIVNGL